MRERNEGEHLLTFEGGKLELAVRGCERGSQESMNLHLKLLISQVFKLFGIDLESISVKVTVHLKGQFKLMLDVMCALRWKARVPPGDCYCVKHGSLRQCALQRLSVWGISQLSGLKDGPV